MRHSLRCSTPASPAIRGRGGLRGPRLAGGSSRCVVLLRARPSCHGHDFAAQAVAAGATSLLCERELDVDAPQLIVADVRATMAHAAAVAAGRPSDRLSIVGVTGTNGKTTVVSILGSILARAS